MNLRQVLHLKRALSIVWNSGARWAIISAALFIVQGILPLILLYLIKLLVDTASHGLAVLDKKEVLRQLTLLIGLTGLVTLIGTLCRSLAGLASETQAQAVSDHMYDIIHDKSIEVDLEYYENSHYYDTLHRAQHEAPFRPARIVNGLMHATRNSISLMAMTGLILSIHWGIALILFAAFIPQIMVRLKYAGITYLWERKRTPTERVARYYNWMLTGDMHAKEIRLFNLGPLFMERFRKLRQVLRNEKIKIATKRTRSEFLSQTPAIIAITGAYLFIVYRTITGKMSIGDLVMYYQALQRGQGYLQNLLSNLVGLYEDNLFLSNLYEFLGLEKRVKKPLKPHPVPRTVETGITFNHVSFRYPNGSTRMALNDISLSIHPGETVALVGENGAGKTTLIKLLCRLYDPTTGQLTIDATDLRHFDTVELRRNISVILQDFAHYQLTAMENIWFGNIESPPDQQGVIHAAELSGADKVIAGLKNGYQTVLGKWFENGEEISIGEWQKIALARAYIRDALIIVLDEPTSALDAKAEYEFFTRFKEIFAGKIAILISHRFSTVKMADKIYVMANGQIIENGSHRELIHQKGKYEQMYMMQAERYK